MTGASISSDGALVPYDDRETIERARRDPDRLGPRRGRGLSHPGAGVGAGRLSRRRPRARLAYDGRNGLPYTSIGRILIETGEIAESAMSLASLKAWLRAAGLREGESGLALMRRNRSFVFFRLVEDFDPALGPVAGAGVPLTPLRSIAVDRTTLELRPAVLDRGRVALRKTERRPRSGG